MRELIFCPIPTNYCLKILVELVRLDKTNGEISFIPSIENSHKWRKKQKLLENPERHKSHI